MNSINTSTASKLTFSSLKMKKKPVSRNLKNLWNKTFGKIRWAPKNLLKSIANQNKKILLKSLQEWRWKTIDLRYYKTRVHMEFHRVRFRTAQTESKCRWGDNDSSVCRHQPLCHTCTTGNLAFHKTADTSHYDTGLFPSIPFRPVEVPIQDIPLSYLYVHM